MARAYEGRLLLLEPTVIVSHGNAIEGQHDTERVSWTGTTAKKEKSNESNKMRKNWAGAIVWGREVAFEVAVAYSKVGVSSTRLKLFEERKPDPFPSPLCVAILGWWKAARYLSSLGR